MTSEELSEACDRLLHPNDQGDGYAWANAASDRIAVATELNARLADDEQREREDAEPINGHVIASLMPKEQFGEALYTNASFVLSSGGRLFIGGVVGDDGGFSVAIHGKPTIKTRGQLRKLLESLKVGDL